MKLVLLSLVTALSIDGFSQNTLIPDPAFEQALINLGYDTGTPDGSVPTANISGVTSLDVDGLGIADLTGIEDFTALTLLYCMNNPLISLDLSNNTALTVLSCFNNQLNSLDVSNNTALFNLWCYNNQLTSLDVSYNTALGGLHCYYNQLTSLDVSNNTALIALTCRDNQLTSLDVSNNSSLVVLRCNDNQLVSLDVSQNFALIFLACFNNQLECLNANNGQDVDLDCSNNPLNCVSVFNPQWSYNNATYDTGVSFLVLCPTIVDNDVTPSGNQLTAVQNGATYQWLDCDNNYAIIKGETNQSYTPATTGFFAAEVTVIDCHGTHTDTSSCHLVDYSSLHEQSTLPKQLLQIVDLMGRETIFKPNTVLIYIYNDGSTERVFKIE